MSGVMTCMRFRGGLTPPNSPDENRNPGHEIVAHLERELLKYGVGVGAIKNIQYAHEIECNVDTRTYSVIVSLDWNHGWWEVFYGPSLSAFDRLRKRTEDDTMEKLSRGIHESILSLRGVIEVRWYENYASALESDYASAPDAAKGVR